MDNSSGDYVARENLWDEQSPQTDQSTGHDAETDDLDELTPFPNAVGTSDALEAVRDAEPYDPPTDPPVLPGGRYGVHIATGFGESALQEAADDGASMDDEDIRQEVVLTLAQDSLTSKLSLRAAVANGVVRLTGGVSSIEDAEYAESLVSNVPGVQDVLDETTIDPNITA